MRGAGQGGTWWKLNGNGDKAAGIGGGHGQRSPAAGPARRRSAARVRVVAAVLLGLLVVSCGRAQGGVPTSPKAPVILISIDTLRADHLPAYGYTKIRTPFIDAFVKDSWLFENAYTPCPMTLPAHTTMLTGELPPEHGVRNNLGFVFDGDHHFNLPFYLKKQGYATGAAVSSYVLRYETGLGHIFDYYDDSVGPTPGVDSVRYRRPGDKTEIFARDWIAKHASEPFFFFFHIYEPHRPWDPPEPFKSLYGATYDGGVASADPIIGTFIADLKKLGVYDRAIVILVGDHGEGLGDHGEEQHSILLYRDVLHVPMIVKFPGEFGAGRRIGVPAQLSDIVPTVDAVLGLPTPKEVSGTSLLDIDGKGRAVRVIFGETLFPRLQLGWSRSPLGHREPLPIHLRASPRALRHGGRPRREARPDRLSGGRRRPPRRGVEELSDRQREAVAGRRGDVAQAGGARLHRGPARQQRGDEPPQSGRQPQVPAAHAGRVDVRGRQEVPAGDRVAAVDRQGRPGDARRLDQARRGPLRRRAATGVRGRLPRGPAPLVHSASGHRRGAGVRRAGPEAAGRGGGGGPAQRQPAPDEGARAAREGCDGPRRFRDGREGSPGRRRLAQPPALARSWSWRR